MALENAAAPDVKLILDFDGVIQEASLSTVFPGEQPDAWIGVPWMQTVRKSDGEHLRRMVEDARDRGVSAFRQVVQRLPSSGREVPIEYTTVRLGERNGLIAVGKNLRIISELQNRLAEAQQTMERDYWKLRELETRYRLLFASSRDAVMLLDAKDLSIHERNAAAAAALGLPESSVRSAGTDNLAELLLPEERGSFERMLRQVRDAGKAPGILMRLGPERETWMVRASLIASAPNEVFLVQLWPSGSGGAEPGRHEGVPVETLLERAPDGFVAIDIGGTILRANLSFLDLVQVGSESALIGAPLGRWLGRPGADIAVLLANVLRLGAVRLLATTLHGELGAKSEVEVSACGSTLDAPEFIGVFVRDIGRRLAVPGPSDENNLLMETRAVDAQVVDGLVGQIGKTSLRQYVEDTVRAVEKKYIQAALRLTAGNRRAAAELVGLSRQSLYVKLARYGLDVDDEPGHGS
jgi:transcriptional regulator PpsR